MLTLEKAKNKKARKKKRIKRERRWERKRRTFLPPWTLGLGGRAIFSNTEPGAK